MGSLSRYFEYVKLYPFLFMNKEENNCIKIILDKDDIHNMQELFYKQADLDNLPRSFFELGVVCEDEWYVAIRDLVIFPNGVKAPYVRFINKKGKLQNATNCVVLPFDKGKVYFQREYSHNLREWQWLTPRGFGEKGLTAEENAKKELYEETGYEAMDLYKISQDLDNDTVLFLAKVDSSVFSHCNDGQEAISDSVWLDFHRFEEWINAGIIHDEYSLRFFIFINSKGFPS
jgi:ADP-ribose pyrophosphatase